MKVNIRFRILPFLFVLFSENFASAGASEREGILDQALAKVERSLATLDDFERMPRNVPEGKSQWKTDAYESWVSGFWPGILWYMYDYSGDEKWIDIAHGRTLPVAKVLNGTEQDHDLGFQFFCSFGNGYRLTGNPVYKDYLYKSADRLAEMFNPTVGTILSWPHARERYAASHNTIIDNLMNLELLFWVARHGGNRAYYDIARQHARVTMDNQIRPDFTHWHVVVYDPETGEAVQKVTRQGYSDESFWARGQAWGIYGFTMVFRETRERAFLTTAIGMADVFLERLPKDAVPFWDFDAPDIPDAPRDASAAAIAASGLLELSGLVDEDEKSREYYRAATRILDSLWENYAASPDSPAVLDHSVGNYPKGKEVSIPIIYGDYYFIEALMRRKEIERRKKLY